MTEICQVLVVEPSDTFRDFLDVVIDHAGYRVTAIGVDRHIAFILDPSVIDFGRFDVVVTSSRLGAAAASAVAFAEAALARGCAVIVVLEDHGDRHIFAQRGFTVLEKPFRPGDLAAELQRLRDRGVIDCTSQDG